MGGHLSHLEKATGEVRHASCGPVRGNSYAQKDGRVVDGYLGVPYAKPPIGELRFKRPALAEIWTDTLECTKYGYRCIQDDTLPGGLVHERAAAQSEDCLTLNVFSPRWTSDEWKDGFPVMVFIHGGAFIMGSSSDYDDNSIAGTLCPKEVVVVTINYRLGPLGFFCTDDENCKGNLGLWDQAMALKWVQTHIKSFGGDANNVTVAGQSAGGASADVLSLSPITRDLFQRVMSMGGCAECDFLLRTSEYQAALSRQFARFIGWDGKDKDTKGLMKFIETHKSEDFKFGALPKQGLEGEQMFFIPVIDGEFLPKPIDELRKEAPKKSILAGATDLEGLLFTVFYPKLPSMMVFQGFLMMAITDAEYGEKAADLRNQIFGFYTKDIDVSDDQKLFVQFVECNSDYSISAAEIIYANEMTKLGNDVYFYSFEHCNPEGFGGFKDLLPFLKCTHGMELRYLLGEGVISKFVPDADDLKMVEITTRLFSNFVKHGNPNDAGEEKWKKHTVERPYEFCRMKLPNIEMADDYQHRRAEMWEKVFNQKKTRKIVYGERPAH